ncbi:MAG: hypothetical protein KA185_11850 [Vitreoscilla sp.]|nr:hypothetical protein [Vitreoscilla sp.]
MAAVAKTRRSGAMLLRCALLGSLAAAPVCGAAAEASTNASTNAAAPGTPRVLREPALQSPKALAAATLAVARAGSRLVAVGERGTVLLSDDAGEHWRQAQTVPVQVTLTAVRFINERTGWAVGHLGVILRSDDAGQTWALQLDGQRAAAAVAIAARDLNDERAQRNAQRFAEEGPDKPFFDLDFADAQHGLAVGAYNLAFATADGGKTWQPALQRLPNPKSLHLYGVRYVGGKVYVVGEQGLLLKSDDGGASFNALASPYKGSFFGLLAARSGALIAYGLRGSAVRSTDQGEHWEALATGLPMSISAGADLGPAGLALLSQTGDLMVSHDDGASFQKIAPSGGPLPAAGLALADDHHLVYASLRGMRRQALP